MNLIPRFYDVTAGAVRDLYHLTLACALGLALCPQDVLRVPFATILYAAPDAPQDAVIEAAKLLRSTTSSPAYQMAMRLWWANGA